MLCAKSCKVQPNEQSKIETSESPLNIYMLVLKYDELLASNPISNL